jgi:hypothetical protein
MTAQILTPAIVLVLWSIVMLLWLAATRLPALKKQGVTLDKAPPGGRGQDLEGVLPAKVQWKTHNYAHLMEQPTIFYATVVILALLGPGALDVTLAWAYVGLRILHSLWQTTINTIPVRFSLFVLATACLATLAVHALMIAQTSAI